MSYSIVIGARTTLVLFHPEAGREDIWEAFREVGSHSDFKAGACLLVDDEGSGFLPTKSDMLSLIGLFKEMGFVAWALVVAQTHHYGMARQVEVYAEEVGFPMRVFKTRPEAEAWIDAADSAVA